MNPDAISSQSDKLNHLIATLIRDPRAIVGFLVLLAASIFLKWKWFYVPAFTIGALAVIYHYTFQRVNVGEASPQLAFFVVGIFLAFIVAAYFLLIKD